MESGAGGRAESLKALTDLTMGMGLVLTLTQQLITIYNSSSRGLLRHQVPTRYTYIQTKHLNIIF